jgi:hypothetical protein
VQKLTNLKIVEARREHCEQIRAHTREAKRRRLGYVRCLLIGKRRLHNIWRLA